MHVTQGIDDGRGDGSEAGDVIKYSISLLENLKAFVRNGRHSLETNFEYICHLYRSLKRVKETTESSSKEELVLSAQYNLCVTRHIGMSTQHVWISCRSL